MLEKSLLIFAKLRTDRSRGRYPEITCHRAPHKPVLLLSVERGVPRENLLIDCLAMTGGADQRAGAITLEAIRRVRDELGMNMTLGASNVSFGLPERETINRAFLPLVLMAGVNCPIVNVAKVRDVILATDLLLGKDEFAMNYIQYCRSHPAGA
jgi:5-methyltetrahydrofolate--homocysteine methyltransferase